MTELAELQQKWTQAWSAATSAWGPSLRMSEPHLIVDGAARDAFAWFDLADVRVNIDLRQILSRGLEDCAVPVLAHEIGHHILAPADLGTMARVHERCRRGLVDRDDRAAEVSNLWTDMLINDRLYRQSGLDMAAPYRPRENSDPASAPPYWRIYLRAYELLWGLPSGELTGGALPADQETDAALMSRHARVFAREPVQGAAGYAALLRKWLDAGADEVRSGCRVPIPKGAAPPGLANDDSMTAPVVHPALDPAVNPEADAESLSAADGEDSSGEGQAYGPGELETTYASMGIARDAAIDWYTARARAHLVPYPVQIQRGAPEEQWEGLEQWELGDELDEIDWVASTQRSTTPVPGFTTVRRVISQVESDETSQRPVDLDLYVDCSGSMPNPRSYRSPAIIGGAILILSALRVGARVQVTSWSSPGQVLSSNGFGRDQAHLMKTLLHFYGGGTSFPLPVLARTYLSGSANSERRAHIAVISDDGVASMFGEGQSDGSAGVAAAALSAARGGGSLILSVPPSLLAAAHGLAGAYDVYGVSNDIEIIDFARQFARKQWGRKIR